MHTPGPWHVYGLDVWAERQMVAASPSGTITELEANARLIAAAPDLLEVLEILAGCVAFPTATHASIVRHAIAKAKGETV